MKLRMILLLSLIFSISLSAQEIKETLFNETLERIQKAKEENINLITPSFYEDALENYKEAEEDFKSGASLNSIKEKLVEVNSYLDKAFKTSEVGKVSFSSVLKARNDGFKVGANLNAKEQWEQAEETLRDAGEDLEDGDMNDANESAKEAEDFFRAAELEAIKKSYLEGTRTKIKEAEELDINDNAPKTIELSKKLVTDCETELNDNRYDMDLPRSLAKQAQYQINHAFYLDKRIKQFEENEETLEDLILESEKEVEKIANSIDVEAKFANGLSEVANNIAEKINDLKRKSTKQEEEIYSLKQEIEVLNNELSGLTKEKSQLTSEMEKLNLIKQKYATVEKIFAINEAQVLRKENDVIIRLVGLSFDVGKAEIKPDNFGLLTKVQKAIKEFPESKILIEGHTDSYGSDAANLDLSQKRADAVLQYLLANMDLDRTKIGATGYGETQPIANNETKEGRAKNRRIDLRIINN